MDLTPTSEDLAFSRSIDRVLSQPQTAATLRARIDDPAVSTLDVYRTVADLGLLAIGLPQEAGGAGGSSVDEALAFAVIGRHVAPITLAAGTIGAHVAAAAGDIATAEKIVSGQVVVAPTVSRPTGEPTLALDLEDAELVLVDDGKTMALHPISAVTIAERWDPLDPSATVHAVEIDGPAEVSTTSAVPRRAAELVAAAMLTGHAREASRLALEYAKTREQFGRPIGANQAIKHHCAEMAVRDEAVQSLVHFAAVALRDRRTDAAFQVAAACHLAADAARANTAACIQIHGAIGYTWEHPIHRHVSRVTTICQALDSLTESHGALLDEAPAIP